MQFTRFLLLFLPPEQFRLFLHRGHGKEPDGRRRSMLPFSFCCCCCCDRLQIRESNQGVHNATYSLYQLLFSNTITSKTTLLESSQMVSCQDIFTPLQEPQNGTRSVFNPEKVISVIQRLNYRRVGVHIGARFQIKAHVPLSRCLNIISVSQPYSYRIYKRMWGSVSWGKAARDA